MAEIRIENVTKRYGSFTALDNLSLTVETASFTSIFGPPSCGKTVLLRVLLGLEPIDEGRIYIDGIEQTLASPSERNFAMVFQNLALFPHLSARKNIAFPLQRRNVPKQEIEHKIEEIAGVLSIGHILHKKPAALSGGERQRVAIARALVRDAPAYLMDEPIAALDARLRDDMRVELKRLQSELGKTFIYVTHDCDEAMSVADTMAILENGHIVQVGKPASIYAQPVSQYVAELVGNPGINVLPASYSSEKIQFAFGDLQLPAEIKCAANQSSPCNIALRPEFVDVCAPGEGCGQSSIADLERLGAFSIATLENDGNTIRAILAGDTNYRIGAEVGVKIDPEGVMLFEPATGNRID